MTRRSISPADHGRWAFNRVAGAYGRRPPYPREMFAEIHRLAPSGPVLDVAAGTGHSAFPLADCGRTVVALEPAAAMLHQLWLGMGDRHVLTCHGAAEAMPLEPACFAAVTVVDAIHWLDAVRAGREIRRVLRPGGFCFVVRATWSSSGAWNALEARLQALRPRSVQDTSERDIHLLRIVSGAPIESFALTQCLLADSDTMSAIFGAHSLAGRRATYLEAPTSEPFLGGGMLERRLAIRFVRRPARERR